MPNRWQTNSRHRLALAVGLGLGLRLWFYLRNPSVWHDELFLIYNLLHKGFGELLGTLVFNQAAPPLFLWVEKCSVLTLGDSTASLRLVPLLASAASLLLLTWLACRLLAPEAAFWAVLAFACSDSLLWHSCETKPYTVDVFAATLIATLFIGPQGWSLERRLCWLAVLAPLLLGLSYPAAFVYGGVVLVASLLAWQKRSTATWFALGMLSVAVAATCGLLWLGPMRAQRNDVLVEYWRDLHHFPPWQQPWAVPSWVIVSTLEIGRYCGKPMGQVFIVLAAIGAVHLARRDRGITVGFLAAPLGLAIVAGLAGAYPYGGSRLLVYMSPALMLLMAEAVPPVADFLKQRTRLGGFVFRALLFIGPVYALGHACTPVARPDCASAAKYVLAHRQEGDAVAANRYEGIYYFRGLGAGFTPVRDARPLAALAPPAPGADCQRLWLLVQGDTNADRHWIGQRLLGHCWMPQSCREFRQVSVWLCLPAAERVAGLSPLSSR